MRISEVRISDYGPFISAHITNPKLLLLFGANGSGKTMILDAIEQTIMSSDLARVSKQAESYFPMAGTEIFFDLDKSSNGEDAELIEKITELVITGHTSNFGQFRHMLSDKPFDRLCDFFSTNYKLPKPFFEVLFRYLRLGKYSNSSELVYQKQDALRSGWRLVSLMSKNEFNELILLAEMLEIKEQVFEMDIFDISSIGDHDFSHIHGSSHEVKAIVEVFDFIFTGKNGFNFDTSSSLSPIEQALSMMAELHGVDGATEILNAVCPTIIRLDDDQGDFEKNLDVCVEALAAKLVFPYEGSSRQRFRSNVSRLKEIAKQPTKSRNDSALNQDVDHQSANNPFKKMSWITSNRQLGVSKKAEQSLGIGSTFSIVPAIESSIIRIEEHANTLLPSFVSDSRRIVLELRSPLYWQNEDGRVACYVEEDNVRLPLSTCSSGIKKFVAIAVELACEQLLEAERTFAVSADKNNHPDVTEINELLDSARSNLSDLYKINLLPSTSNSIVLVDEPEAHLHPLAVTSVADWLNQVANQSVAVIVASHNPSIFNLRGSQVQKTIVNRVNHDSFLVDWSVLSSEEMSSYSRSVGISEGELILLARYFLLVEGPHDEIILNCFFGDWFRSSGIRIYPLHGLFRGGKTSLLESEIIGAMGIPIGILADNTANNDSEEAKYLRELKREANNRGRSIDVWGFDKEDILWYLPPEVVKSFANERFTTWEELYAEWKTLSTSKRGSFKMWITQNCNLELAGNRKLIEQMAEQTKELKLINSEMITKVSMILAKVGVNDLPLY